MISSTELFDSSRFKGVLVHGKNTGLVYSNLDFCLKHFSTTHSIVKIFDVDVEEDENVVAKSYLYNGFFDLKEKLIVFYNPETQLQKQIVAFLEKANDSIFTVVISDYLESSSSLRKVFEGNKKKFNVIACYEDTKQTAIGIAKQEFTKNKITFNDKDVDYLCSMIYQDRGVLKNEIKKIVFLARNNDNTLTQEIINSVCENQTENSIMMLIVAFFEKNHVFFEYFRNIKNEEIKLISFLIALRKYLFKIKNTIVGMKNGESLDFLIKENRIFFTDVANFKKHVRMLDIEKCFKFFDMIDDVEKNAIEVSEENGIEILLNHFIKHNLF